MGGAGGDIGTGKPPAGVLAGLTWLTWTVRQTMSSSYVTWYALGTLFIKKGLTSTLRRSSHHEDEVTFVIRIADYRSWRWGHLLVCEGESLANHVHIGDWILSRR